MLRGRVVDKIRVLLANHPMMIPDAIRDLLMQQDDMELVGDCRGPMKILQETGRTKADAVILAQEGTDEPGLCSQLLAVYPDVTLLCMTSDMETAYTQQLRSSRHKLSSFEVRNVAQVLRVALGNVGRETIE
jgi:DNA-binding NarL/FixJ family response regulator